MIRTCLFDMGNVLVRFSHERMCAQIAALCRCESLRIRELFFDDGMLIEFESGRVTEDQMRQRCEEIAGFPLDAAAWRHAKSDIFELNEGMPELLRELKAGGRRLVLLSNTSIAHFEFVRERFDVLDAFDAFVVSYEAGAVKPEPAIFQTALDVIQCAPQECFYTDDIPEYVAIGRENGLDAEVFTGVSSLLAQLGQRGIELSRNGSPAD